MNEISTLFDLIELNATRYSIRKAFLLRDEDEQIYITYRKFYSHSKRLASALLEKNKGKTNIAVCMENSYQRCVSYFAVAIGAGVAVPLDNKLSDDSLFEILNYADIHCAITDKNVAEKILEFYDDLPADFLLICTEKIMDARVEFFDDILVFGKSITREGYNLLLDNLNNPEDPAVLLFTSGSFSNPKAVLLSNKNLVSDIIGVSQRINVNYNDRTLCTLPLYHSYQCMVMLTLLYIGGIVSFSRNLRNSRDDMQFYKPTIVATVPLVLEKTHKKIYKKLSEQNSVKRSLSVGKIGSLISKSNDERLKKIVYSQIYKAFGGDLRCFLVGGASTNEDIVKDFSGFGFPVIIGYGLTECSPIVACNSFENPTSDTVGEAIEGVELKIENPDEEGIGEVCIKGDIVMLGYYKNENLTEETIADGWFHSGDLGYIDENNNLHITGRIKNVIIGKNGKNIYPEELEDALRTEPVILEALIFSDEDEEDSITVEIVPNESAIKQELDKEELSSEEIEQAIDIAVKKTNKKLPMYKRIKRVKVNSDSLSKTDTQKVKRKKTKHNISEE